MRVEGVKNALLVRAVREFEVNDGPAVGVRVLSDTMRGANYEAYSEQTGDCAELGVAPRQGATLCGSAVLPGGGNMRGPPGTLAVHGPVLENVRGRKMAQAACVAEVRKVHEGNTTKQGIVALWDGQGDDMGEIWEGGNGRSAAGAASSDHGPRMT